MGDRIPNITLTNPFNRDQAPSPAQSPIRGGGDGYSNRWPELNSVAGLINGGPSITPSGSRGMSNPNNEGHHCAPVTDGRLTSGRQTQFVPWQLLDFSCPTKAIAKQQRLCG